MFLSAELRLGVRRSFDLALVEVISSTEKEIDLLQCDSTRIISKTIRERLSDGYTAGRAERGTGCVSRIKDLIFSSIELNRETIFKFGLGAFNGQVVEMVKTVTVSHGRCSPGVSALYCSRSIVCDADCDLQSDQCLVLPELLSPLCNFVHRAAACSLALRQVCGELDFNSAQCALPLLKDRVEPCSLYRTAALQGYRCCFAAEMIGATASDLDYTGSLIVSFLVSS